MRIEKQTIIFVAGLCTPLLCAACSTVESIDVSKAREKDRDGAYINYTVGKSLFTIQIAAASDGSKSQSGTSANASSTTNSTTTPTSWTISGTVTPAGGGSGSDSSQKGNSQATSDASYCGALTAQYVVIQKAVAGNISIYNTLQTKLTQTAVGNPASGDTPKTVSEAVNKYVKAIKGDAYQQLLNPDTGLAIALYDQLAKQCPTNVTVTVQQSFVPDMNHTFALKPGNNPLYSDTLNFTTDANGFPTNAAPASVSQVPAILGTIANDIGQAVAPHSVTSHPIQPRAENATCPRPPISGLENQIAALACTAASSTNAEIIALEILGDLPLPGSVKPLPSTLLPITIYAPIDEIALKNVDENGHYVVETAESGESAQQLATVTKLFQLDAEFDCTTRSFANGHDNFSLENPHKPDMFGQASEPGVYDGIVVSAPRTCRFLAKQARSDGAGATANVVVAQNYFWALDSRDLVLLPTQRGIFVARSTTYTFSNGQVTGVNDSRPSEVAALVALPGNIVGTFISGVTTGVSNNLAFINGQTSDITAQVNKTNAETNLVNAKASLKKTQDAAPPH